MNSVFKIQLSNFHLYSKKGEKPGSNKHGKMLRFNLSWRLDIPPANPELGEMPTRLGCTLISCLAFVSVITGELYWHPAHMRTRTNFMSIAMPSPDLYEKVKRLLMESEYYKQILPRKSEIWRNAEELKEPTRNINSSSWELVNDAMGREENIETT